MISGRNFKKRNKTNFGNSLVVQWLGLSAFTALGLGSFPGQRTKIPQAARHSKKKIKKKFKKKKKKTLKLYFRRKATPLVV